MVRPGDRVIFVEVKGDGDKIRPEQQQWLDDLKSAGQEVYVWTPQDLDSDSVLEALTWLGPSRCEVCGDSCPSHRNRCAKHLLETTR
jgi:hypothetical protein